ncbi:carboxypeptidase C (cathepsin A) [Nitrospirillum amazonense]|uniref:Carboxypeptidase C (Cathepsin A) n=1 Tax=Nitrospirillum amazonense TaxID=28077 RepID=A0A560EWY8_9PROT|nr:peptidase S10 [Nitrospirillum amazonense]TWB13864.1 carboxypeptidase C (cathepsin A) [Nitrospirillum amazonense]
MTGKAAGRKVGGLMAALMLATSMPAFADAPAVTHHTTTLNGHKLAYTATVEGTGVNDAAGKPGAHLVSFAYTADTKDAAKRPVTFVFNGGPITASLWLHLGVMGPKRVAVPDDLKADPATFTLVDNPYSPLDATDLVFVDPASTGFSRVADGVDPKSYFSVKADGQEVTAFIQAWLAQHHREGSPVYLLGESYGTMRAAEVAGQLAELPKPIPLAGVLLMGQAVNIIEYVQRPQNIMSYVVSLPTLAAIAWYHQRVDRHGLSLEAFVDEARRYAQSDYMPALYQGSELPSADRDRVAQRLQELTGIPAAYYRDHALRISKEQYRGELLKDQGLLLGRADARYAVPITDKGIGPDPFAAAVMPPFSRLFKAYIHDDLKVDRTEPYVEAAEVGGLDDWGWSFASPFANWAYSDRLLKAMKANPKMQLLIGNGYYDTQTTVGAAELLARQGGWPDGRVRLTFYEGGHMAYTDEGAARKFGADVRAFVHPAP